MQEAALKKLLDDKGKDNVLTFEKLGVDYLFVDEADAYKNLFMFTKMNNVAGISKAASARASDMQLKTEYITELRGGDKGVVFATGTPISNSMAEMYIMQTYLQKRTLEKLGITFFDNWAADFGETVTALELSPSGQGYRTDERYGKAGRTGSGKENNHNQADGNDTNADGRNRVARGTYLCRRR